MWLRSTVWADAVVVEVGAQVVATRLGVGEQVPDDQDGASDRDDGSLFAAAFGDAAVAFPEEGGGLASGDSSPLRVPGLGSGCRVRWCPCLLAAG
jgi:hypothetical protein